MNIDRGVLCMYFLAFDFFKIILDTVVPKFRFDRCSMIKLETFLYRQYRKETFLYYNYFPTGKVFLLHQDFRTQNRFVICQAYHRQMKPE